MKFVNVLCVCVGPVVSVVEKPKQVEEVKGKCDFFITFHYKNVFFS